MRPFRDRIDAGKKLAIRLTAYAVRKPIVIALPRGGLPVAHEIALQLGAPLDIIGVKKIGAPGNPELAIGAVTEDGVPVLHEWTFALHGAALNYVIETTSAKATEATLQAQRLRAELPPLAVRGRTVLVVDDGLATGATMDAAVETLRRRGAKEIVVAVPVAAFDALAKVAAVVDDVVALLVARDFYAVGEFYDDFSEVTDEEAIAILRARRHHRASEEDRRPA